MVLQEVPPWCYQLLFSSAINSHQATPGVCSALLACSCCSSRLLLLMLGLLLLLLLHRGLLLLSLLLLLLCATLHRASCWLNSDHCRRLCRCSNCWLLLLLLLHGLCCLHRYRWMRCLLRRRHWLRLRLRVLCLLLCLLRCLPCLHSCCCCC
jgi:hypothetical protein